MLIYKKLDSYIKHFWNILAFAKSAEHLLYLLKDHSILYATS